MKKFLILTVALISIIEISHAQDFKADGIYYKILSDGVSVEVTNKKGGHRDGRDSYKGSVVIPSTVVSSKKSYVVTKIGERAFYSCLDLISITLPNSVTTIESEAFLSCHRVASMTIPHSVTTIGGGAFGRMGLKEIINNSDNFIVENGILYDREKTVAISALQYAVGGYKALPRSVRTIEDYAFANCVGLTSINLPSSLITIKGNAFAFCSNLASINIPDSVKTISNTAFFSCKKLGSVTIPYGTTYDTKYIGSSTSYPKAVRLTKADADRAAAAKRATEAANVLRLAEDIREGKGSLSDYVKYYIEQDINEWQIKGEFEPTAAWKARVNETTRKAKINTLMEMYSNRYCDIAKRRKTAEFKSQTMSLMSYDADNQSFLIQTATGNILLPVPLSTAQSFKSNWESVKKSATPDFTLSGDDVVLSAITFTYAGRQYTYDGNTNVKYAITDIQYNFDPIDIGVSTTVATNVGIGGNSGAVERRSLSVGASDVAINIPQTTIKNNNTFVLIIANENYTSEATVNFAINDGQTFKKYCERTLGVPSANIKIVEDATVGSMNTNINWLQRVLRSYGDSADAIVYYSGHGIPNEAKGDAYLLPTDITGADYQYAYSLNKLYNELGESGAGSITYFIDACFSGAKRDGEMMIAARGVAIKAKSGVLRGNSVAFTASSGDETAFAYDEKGHGMFTYFLLKKLQESRGNVTYGELASYITTNVSRLSNVVNPKAQTPTVIPSPTLQSSWQELKFAR